ncbi:MAG TPA: IPT/TIG domain-containing protein [Bryobacteraceae bacterium]|nr:IPT/TIG domain-containing protein [Bryobacteraceae bacterium]
MKWICAFLLSAASLCAADFVTGQAARLVIGQTSFTAADPNSSNTTIGGASGVAYAADTLFIADDNRIGAVPNNNRVLIFPNLSGQLPGPTTPLSNNSICPICVGAASVVLGQPDFVTATTNFTTTQNNIREPTAVASDGVHLVVADTNHNRILIWNHIPTTNNAPADVVIGQPNFNTSTVPTNGVPTAKSVNGPQGVWIQNGRLYVADTQNNRVLIYNRIPTTNGVAADVVLGQPNFTTFVQVDIAQQNTSATATNMLNPVSVTSDGTHLFVTDLGFNRILIWNSIPATNAQAADVEIGQPDMNSGVPNYAFNVSYPDALVNSTPNFTESPVLCSVSNGTDANGNATYPLVCNYVLNFPRFALSDGTRLFVADGGNDRILEYKTIPTQNAAAADIILGQVGGSVDQATDAADSVNTPTSLAFDGTNLYAADPYNRRITVYTVAPNTLPYQSVVNVYNPNVYATGSVLISGTINNGDIVTITINTAEFPYTVKATDTLTSVIAALVSEINAGSQNGQVTAIENDADSAVTLQAVLPGTQGGAVAYSATVSSNAQIAATAADTQLDGGGNAASVAPGTIVTINGSNLASDTVSADLTQPTLPTSLGGVQVYMDGIPVPLTYVSPNQVNAQVPWEFTSTTSVNVYVVSQINGGSTFTSPVALTIVSANPGLSSVPGTSNPQIGIATHYSSYATAIVSVDGTINAGDVATVAVRGRSYTYTVQSTDTLDTVRDALIAELQQDPEVTAAAAGVFDRIIVTANIAGPEGDAIPIGGSSSSGADITVTAFDTQTCCSNIAGARVTQDNPARAGELINVFVTGMGLPILTSAIQPYIVTGSQYPIGGPNTIPQQFANALAGGATADVIQATLMPGTVGLFDVVLHLSPTLGSNVNTEVTVAQGFFVSNAVAVPVVSQ